MNLKINVVMDENKNKEQEKNKGENKKNPFHILLQPTCLIFE